jgi:tetratricopeptide (TPR) repeat protein
VTQNIYMPKHRNRVKAGLCAALAALTTACGAIPSPTPTVAPPAAAVSPTATPEPAIATPAAGEALILVSDFPEQGSTVMTDESVTQRLYALLQQSAARQNKAIRVQRLFRVLTAKDIRQTQLRYQPTLLFWGYYTPVKAGAEPARTVREARAAAPIAALRPGGFPGAVVTIPNAQGGISETVFAIMAMSLANADPDQDWGVWPAPPADPEPYLNALEATKALDAVSSQNEAGMNTIRGNNFDAIARPDDARRAYRRAIELEPDWPEAYNGLGALELYTKNPDGALEALGKSLELDPNQGHVYLTRSVAYQDKRDFTAALADLNKALELNPRSAFAYMNRAGVHKDMGNMAAAASDYDCAIQLRPDYPNAWSLRGLFLSELGKEKEALADYDRAIQMGLDDAFTWNGRAWALALQGEFARALEDVDKAIKLNPNLGFIRDTRAFALAGLGRHREAVEEFDKALALQPDLIESICNRGISHKALGNAEKAIEDLKLCVDGKGNLFTEKARVALAELSATPTLTPKP